MFKAITIHPGTMNFLSVSTVIPRLRNLDSSQFEFINRLVWIIILLQTIEQENYNRFNNLSPDQFKERKREYIIDYR